MFGGNKNKFENTGITFSIAGIQKNGWDESTLFVDTGEGDPPQILTETKQDEAPFKYHLTTLKNIRPGKYSLEFSFIYYNGQSWKSSSKSIDFKVQNFFERHDGLIGFLALAATVSGLIRFAVIPIGGWIWSNVCQYF